MAEHASTRKFKHNATQDDVDKYLQRKREGEDLFPTIEFDLVCTNEYFWDTAPLAGDLSQVDWFNKWPHGNAIGSMKKCTSFLDYFNSGFVFGAPSDIVVIKDKGRLGDIKKYIIPDDVKQALQGRDYLRTHPARQTTDAIKFAFPGYSTVALKIRLFWSFRSHMPLTMKFEPLYYEEYPDVIAIPGQQPIQAGDSGGTPLNMFMKADKDFIEIKKGTPLVRITPSVKTDYVANMRMYNPETDQHDTDCLSKMYSDKPDKMPIYSKIRHRGSYRINVVDK